MKKSSEKGSARRSEVKFPILSAKRLQRMPSLFDFDLRKQQRLTSHEISQMLKIIIVVQGARKKADVE